MGLIYMKAKTITLVRANQHCYIMSLDGLLDHTISISSVLEPSLPPSCLRLKKPLYTPSVTTLSIWMVTRPSVDCKASGKIIRQVRKESHARRKFERNHMQKIKKSVHGRSQIPFQTCFCFCTRCIASAPLVECQITK